MGLAKKIGGRRHRTCHGSSTSTSKLPSLSTSDYLTHLNQAKQWIEEEALDIAFPLLHQLHQLQPMHLETLYYYGLVSLEVGQPDLAFSLFNQYHHQFQSHSSLSSLLLSSTTDPTLLNTIDVLLHLAQLHSHEQSVEHYLQAIQVLEQIKDMGTTLPSPSSKDSEVVSDVAQVNHVHKELVQAYCALAEVYLTDLCFDPKAPELCQVYLEKAIAISPHVPEPYITLTSLFLSKQELELAQQSLETSLNLWWHHWTEFQSNPKLSPLTQLPSYATRKLTAQLCMECECISKALDVLSTCVHEYQDDVQVWYLFGWGYWLQYEQQQKQGQQEQQEQQQRTEKEDEKEEDLKDILTDAMTCFTKAKKLYERQHFDDPPLLEHVLELLHTLESKGIVPDVEDDQEKEEGQVHLEQQQKEEEEEELDVNEVLTLIGLDHDEHEHENEEDMWEDMMDEE